MHPLYSETCTLEEKRTYWSELLSIYSDYDKSKRAFCSEHGLKLDDLNYRLNKEKRDSKQSDVSNKGFIPVSVHQDRVRDERFTLTLSTGHKLEIPNRFDEYSLKRLLCMLGGLSC